MALFGRKEKTEKDGSSEQVQQASSAVAGAEASSLIRPHITEKAAIATDNGVYVFVVDPRANKHDVKAAVKELYKKTPRKVAIVKKPGKRVLRRSGMGTKKGLKKAYVYMKEGETLDIL